MLPQDRQGRGKPVALSLTPLLLPEACWHCPHGGLGKAGHPAPGLGSQRAWDQQVLPSF